MQQSHCNTPVQRIRLASSMLAHEGTYGIASRLSREHTISRQALYKLRARGRKGMERVFFPKEQKIEEEEQISRIVLTLLVDAHASREGIQSCIEKILGVHVSLGTISSIIHQAGKQAQEYLKRCIPQGKKALALDEQYGSERGKGYLNIVDVLSGVVVASIPPVTVDTESWALLLWQMQEQGLQWDMMVSDGGKAIQSAVQQVAPDSIHQRDVWHVLHECQKVQGRIDRALDQLQKQTPTVEQQAKRVEAGQKPRGRNPKTDVIAHTLDVHQMEYIASSLRYLSSELQTLLGIIVLKEHKILDSCERQEELDTLLRLFYELYEVTPKSLKEDVKKLVHHIENALPGLVGFCPELDPVQESAEAQLGEQAVHLIGWAWLERATLGPKTNQLAADFPPTWQPIVTQLFEAWDQAVRSSSAVENWHSILRPHLAVHRGLSADLLALLAVWHNHRVAPRGLHLGQSPLMRAGLETQPTDWLAALRSPHLTQVRPSPSAGDSAQPQTESIAA
jgi:hypothetical protein